MRGALRRHGIAIDVAIAYLLAALAQAANRHRKASRRRLRRAGVAEAARR